MTIQLTLPKFTLLEKLYASDAISCCDRCDREIKNSYIIRNNEDNSVHSYGSGCAKHVMGISITEVVEQNKAYDEDQKRIGREAEQEAMGRTYIQSFNEANPKMLQFIAEGATDNNFLSDMKKRIEETGSLTDGQFHAVYRMMLPFAQLDDKVKDMKVYPSKVQAQEGQWGWSYTVTCITENDEKVRIFFSSLNLANGDLLEKCGVLDGDLFPSRIDKENPILVSGSFDGYKIKRAKIKGA